MSMIMKAMLAGGIIIIVSALAIAVVVNQRHQQRQDSTNKQHREFCTGVRMAMHEDARDFEGGDKAKQEAARLKFFDSQIIYHGSQSISMCVDKLPSIPSTCVANADYACLAGIARDIERGIE